MAKLVLSAGLVLGYIVLKVIPVLCIRYSSYVWKPFQTDFQ